MDQEQINQFYRTVRYFMITTEPHGGPKNTVTYYSDPSGLFDVGFCWEDTQGVKRSILLQRQLKLDQAALLISEKMKNKQNFLFQLIADQLGLDDRQEEEDSGVWTDEDWADYLGCDVKNVDEVFEDQM